MGPSNTLSMGRNVWSESLKPIDHGGENGTGRLSYASTCNTQDNQDFDVYVVESFETSDEDDGKERDRDALLRWCRGELYVLVVGPRSSCFEVTYQPVESLQSGR